MKKLFLLIIMLFSLNSYSQIIDSEYVGTNGVKTVWESAVPIGITFYDSTTAFIGSEDIDPIVVDRHIEGGMLYVTVLDGFCMCPIRRLRGTMALYSYYH